MSPNLAAVCLERRFGSVHKALHGWMADSLQEEDEAPPDTKV